MLHTLLPRFLLVLILLSAQLAGWVHGVEHTLEEHRSAAALSHDAHCELCELYDQLGNAMRADAQAFAAPQQFSAHMAVVLQSHASPSRIVYTARAPPSIA